MKLQFWPKQGLWVPLKTEIFCSLQGVGARRRQQSSEDLLGQEQTWATYGDVRYAHFADAKIGDATEGERTAFGGAVIAERSL